ncbi:histidine phosphatase family protein [Magnetospirillum sp. UT-4]|uniref:histidine phosphatase family protein n=1 Tax=Magnetospirillum sp. UT-4 TaxID=2681467 RepID=UPI0013816AA6|nr:histidine phosphatase family protein [Magnetospirillum sp. UT-4]CAA7625107.1 Fructose-2,6-bisphosphatase [Magnetospirillum sp. UT-4]
MPTIILIRHGETIWNRARLIQGHLDVPLTLKGIEQARAYGRVLPRLVGDGQGWRLVSSPLARCVQTLAILAETAGLDPLAATTDRRLMEVDTGAFSGRTKAELTPDEAAGSGRHTWYFRCPGGETHADLSARLSSWLAERTPGEKLVVVSHGVAGKVLRGLYAGTDSDAAIAQDSPQNALFLLSGGTVERVECI